MVQQDKQDMLLWGLRGAPVKNKPWHFLRILADLNIYT